MNCVSCSIPIHDSKRITHFHSVGIAFVRSIECTIQSANIDTVQYSLRITIRRTVDAAVPRAIKFADTLSGVKNIAGILNWCRKKEPYTDGASAILFVAAPALYWCRHE